MRVALVTVLALSACSEEPSGGGGPNVNSEVRTYEWPGRSAPKVDVLVVLDDTTAMQPHQTMLASLAGDLETVMTEQLGALPDARIGVITAGAPAFRQPSGASVPWLETTVSADFTRTENFQGSLADALAPLLAVGASGTSTTQPLEATKLALAAQPFVRDPGYLAIVTITASDDASTGTPASYADALKAAKPDPLLVVASGVYPDGATRLDAFHAALPNRNATADIASNDWSNAFALLAQLFKSTLAAPCFVEPADLAPDIEGPQYDCALASYFEDGTSEVLPQCTANGPARCFEFVTDAAICTEAETKRLTIRGFLGPFHPTVRGECVVD